MPRMLIIRTIKTDADIKAAPATEFKLHEKKVQLSRVLKFVRKNSFITLTPFNIHYRHDSTNNLNLQPLFLKTY